MENFDKGFYRVSIKEFHYSIYLIDILNNVFENIMVEELDYFFEYKYYSPHFNDIRMKFEHIYGVPF